MTKEIRTLGRHAAIYGIGNMIAKLASFVMLPIYTRYLTPADYGVLELMSMTIDLIGILTGAALSAAVYPFYAERQATGEENLVLSTSAIGLIGLSMFAALLGLIAAPALSTLITPENGHPVYFRLFFLIFIAQSAELVPFMMCRALHRSMIVVVVNLARLLGLIALNIVFVVHLHLGVMGILISNLVISGVIATGMLVYLFRTAGREFSTSLFKQMAKYAYPVAFASLGNFFLVYSDRYFLNHYVGAAAVGAYSLAYRFGFILANFVFHPFQQVWLPQRFFIAKQANARDIFRRVFLYLNIALGGLGLMIALFVQDVLKVMTTHAFWSAAGIVPFILLAQIIQHWTAYNNLGLFLTKTTKKFAWASAVAIPSVLILNMLLIPRYSVWGAVGATLIAFLLRFAVIHGLAQREYHIDYDWRRIFGLYAILIGAYVVRLPFGDRGIALSVTIGGVLACLAFAGVYRLILNDGERHALNELLHRQITWRSLITPATRPASAKPTPAPVEAVVES